MLRARRRVLSEESIPYRIAVLSTVLVAVGAVGAEGGVSPGTAAAALLLIPAGYVLSYVRRDRRNIFLKAALAASLFVAFGNFMRAVQGSYSIDDARLPLAELFVWVQVLHSFDLPRRRDLNFSLASSLTSIAMAGTLSFSMRYALFLVLYIVAGLCALALAHLGDLRARAGATAAAEQAAPVAAARRRGGLRAPAAVAAVLASLTAVMFLAMPRLPGVKLTALPFSIAKRTPIAGFAGEVFNPGRAAAGGGFARDAYFGYGEDLDLRVRGRLSEDLVMRVRASEGAFWRAQVYDTYGGGRWTSSDTDLYRARAFAGSIRVGEPSVAGHELVQTFYIERQLPNLVFHALEAKEVFTPASSVRVDDFGSIRLPFVLEPDTIYSVISAVPDATQDALRGAGPPDPSDPELARYLQLPDELPERVRALGVRLAASEGTQLDRVLAVERWLKRNTRYNLDIPRDPPGADPVDYFLFERREGFCEQIASSMVVLLRAAGIPARLSTGFTPGERNPFTGYWEVRNSDAHTWVEVPYPGFGWVQYDPTHEVPDATTRADDLFVIRPALRFAGGLVPEPVRRFVTGAAGTVAVPIGVTALAVALVAVAGVRRRGRTRAASPRERIVAAWLGVERALERRGIRRGPAETVRELASRIRSDGIGGDAFSSLVEQFLASRYGRDPGDPEAFEDAARAAIERLASTRPALFSGPSSTTR